MIEIGSYNNLNFKRKTYDGVILTDGEREVLLPAKELISYEEDQEEFFVFVYLNKDENLVATLERPFACVGDFAYLTVVGENEKGVFVDIGIDKDVFVPAREQKRPMFKGDKHVVYVYLDERSGKITASSYLDEYVDVEVGDLEEGDEVSLLICERSELGYSAIINNRYIGLLYHNEVYEELEIGEEKQGFIKKIRENKKIDLSLRPIGFDFILESKDVLLEIIKKNGGVLKLGDKSDPEEIKQQLKMSKKAFKQVIGGLYKQRLITISDFEIRLVEQTGE
ncbi:S1 RNA-binding domain-containing protein [Pedobacter sp. SYSU D00535]|uniref:CvfB family protein n=1 Tax=Pedobacter sp. SYSU D00535 TaxID=2810308 RepID=UPI001A95ACB1|nr:S1-like domain-containing RNA-binding protein [Pedobacter sp. SYSU D00535]